MTIKKSLRKISAYVIVAAIGINATAHVGAAVGLLDVQPIPHWLTAILLFQVAALFVREATP